MYVTWFRYMFQYNHRLNISNNIFNLWYNLNFLRLLLLLVCFLPRPSLSFCNYNGFSSAVLFKKHLFNNEWNRSFISQPVETPSTPRVPTLLDQLGHIRGKISFVNSPSSAFGLGWCLCSMHPYCSNVLTLSRSEASLGEFAP